MNSPGASTAEPPSLLQRVAEGDSDALEQCVDQHGRLVWSLARRYSRDLDDAEDAVQEVFLSLWKSAHRFDPRVASEATFVTVVARRRLIDRHRRSLRRQGREVLSSELPDPPDPGEDPASSATSEVERARAALKTLRPEQRRVLSLGIDRGLSHQEIADVTGLPLGTVKTHARRGLARVRQLLGVDREEGSK